jgi:hypothetical protein
MKASKSLKESNTQKDKIPPPPPKLKPIKKVTPGNQESIALQ